MKMNELKTGQYFKLKNVDTLKNEHLSLYYDRFCKYKDNYLFTAIKCNINDEFSMDEDWYLVDTVQFPRLKEEAFANSEILLAYVNDKQFNAYHNVWKFGTPFIVKLDEDILDHLDLQFDLRDYDIVDKEDTYKYLKEDLIENVVFCCLAKDNPRCLVKKNTSKDKKSMIFKEVVDTLSLLTYPQVNDRALIHLKKLEELTSGEYDAVYDEVFGLVDLITESQKKLEGLFDSHECIGLQADMKFGINWNATEKKQKER